MSTTNYLPNLFVLSSSGEVLIEKHWISKVKRTVCDLYVEQLHTYQPAQALLNKTSSNGADAYSRANHINATSVGTPSSSLSVKRHEVPPIIATPRYYLAHVSRSDCIFLTAIPVDLQVDISPLFVLECLYRLSDIIVEYFGPSLTDTLIRNYFSTVYQLIDEMIDGGYPSTTEGNQLKDMILPPSLTRHLLSTFPGEFLGTVDRDAVSRVLPQHAVSKIPWRKFDVKYTTNEIYFDLVESIDATIGTNGRVQHASIYGEIHVNCRLSGMPDLTLSFTRPALLDDCNLHRCVRINRYQRERVVSFVPPDGEFVLLTYRINDNQQTPSGSHNSTADSEHSMQQWNASSSSGSSHRLRGGHHVSSTSYGNVSGGLQIPLYVRPIVTFSADGYGKVHITVGPRNTNHYNNEKPINHVVVILPLPSVITSSSLTANIGTVTIDSQKHECRWNIGKLARDNITPTLSGHIQIPSSASANGKRSAVIQPVPVVRVEFSVKMLAASGLKVDGLAIRGVPYKPFKGVRSTTQAGKFQIRCSDV